jgi:hypothetical protein
MLGGDDDGLLCPFDGPFGDAGLLSQDGVLGGRGRGLPTSEAGLSEDDGCSEDSGFDPLRQMVSPASVHHADVDVDPRDLSPGEIL